MTYYSNFLRIQEIHSCYFAFRCYAISQDVTCRPNCDFSAKYHSFAGNKNKFILTIYEKRVEEKDLPFFIGLNEKFT